MNNSQKRQSIILRVIWRFLLCIYAPFLYTMDLFENLISEPHQYADGNGWSFERTKVPFFMYWYRY
jgi:hypothetical protein